MKHIVFFLLLLAGIAQQSHAEIIASMANDAGGRIDLYSAQIPKGTLASCDGKYVAKTWGSGIKDAYGCWNIDNDLISIHWVGADGSYRSYPMSSFTMTQKNSGNTKPAKGTL
jgi:hypothetical protein